MEIYCLIISRKRLEVKIYIMHSAFLFFLESHKIINIEQRSIREGSLQEQIQYIAGILKFEQILQISLLKNKSNVLKGELKYFENYFKNHTLLIDYLNKFQNPTLHILHMDKKRSVAVLFLGSIQRSEDYQVNEKPTDEIDFGKPVKVTLIRIPKPKRELYGRHTSITQSEPIKGFEIYFRNLEETSGRYSLLTSTNDLMITSTQDVLITPTKPFTTDLLVIRGSFMKLSLCVYGNVVEASGVSLWGKDAAISESGMAMEIKRNIFEEKRSCIHIIESELEDLRISGRESINLSTADVWQESTNDDDINEPQIKNICNISQHLLNTFQQINEDQYIVKFRENIENINNHLQKLFKSKQIGLYYPKQQNVTIQNQIPLPLVHIALSSLKLALSDQFRVLEMLKMLAQLPRHANALIESGGVSQLSSLFIEFYKPNAVFFSTFKNLVLEVCIALAQWPTAAQQMVMKLEQDFFEEMYQPFEFKQKQSEQKKQKGKEKEKLKQLDKQKSREKSREKDRDKQKSKGKSRSRSRDKAKQKRSKSDDSDSDDDNDSKRKKEKKDKKDKKDKKKKEKEKSKKRDKYGDDKKDKQKQKKKDKTKDKQKQKQKEKEKRDRSETNKKEQTASPVKAESSVSQSQVNQLSFYQLLFFVLLQEKNSKTLNLIKILIEQISQTLTKNKDISQQIASVTSFLRDTKYLFNQGTEIINSKSLKIFATFQPFLNDNQSQNVDCKYISQKQKLKNPLKYGINPKTFKIVNKINQSIVTNAHKESLGIGTPFDQHFMVMMSQLLFQNEKSILSGFNRIANAFKADGLMHLQRNEAAISIIVQYIYKALLDDEGINTFVYIEQIHASLIKFTSLLNQDPSLFSTELKSRIRLLANYATPYDHFNRAEGNFKVFCEYFLRLFKYDNYQIQINNKAKLTDFRKKEYDKLINPFTFDNLSENFAMKNFNDVAANQPLVEIDVCLKIFLILCDYNKNIWTTFYENKLISGFSSLLNKVSNLLLFFLQHSANRWTSYGNTKSYLLNMDNYLTVVKHVLMLMAKKCRYESAYNDLLQEDIFEDVELYEKSIQIYIHLYNALHDESVMIYTVKSRNKIKVILALIIQILDQFSTAYELITHQTRQMKLRRLLEYIYITHYSSLKSRAAILSIYSQLLKHAEGATCKYFSLHLLDGHFTLSKLLENQVAYTPQNDRSMIQNIIKSNLYRADPLITNNLAILIRNLFAKTQYIDKTLDLIERLFDEIDEQYKKNEEENSQVGWKNLRKAHLFTEVLVRTEITFKSRLDDKLMRFFKRLSENFRKRVDMRELSELTDQQNFIVFLKIKNNFMSYFCRLLRQTQENGTILLQFFETTVKSLYLQHFNFQLSVDDDFGRKVNYEALRSCQIYVQGLAQIGLITSYQCLLLYGEILQKPYKPQTIISFVDIIAALERIISAKIYQEDSPEMKEVRKIVCSIFYFLCTLTTINEEELFTTESRRGAIVYLIAPNDKEFPFAQLRQSCIFRLIPKDFVRLLQEYFSYPIVQKPIVCRPKPEAKPPVKTKSGIYSKCVFSIISEHDPVSKTRYKYIGGEWVGGDIQKSLYTPFRLRNYEQEIQKFISPREVCGYEQYHYRDGALLKENIIFNELFYLSTRKDRQEAPKKEVERTIQLKDVMPKLTPQQIKKEIPLPSPSPSKLTNPMGVNLVSPPSNVSNVPMTSPIINKQQSLSNDRNYNNKPGGPRSGSQGSGPATYGQANYYGGSSANTSRPQNPPMTSHYAPPPAMHGGYPPQGPYPYYNPPPGMYPPQRYPPGPYPPMGHQNMYPPAMNKPMGGMYNQPMGGMYQPIPQNQLNQYEQQMFQEAYQLVNQIKNSGMNLSEQEINSKKSRLNYILSGHPKVHTKLKDSLLGSQS